MPPLDPDLAWLAVAAIALALIGLCLSIIGIELENANRRAQLLQDAARLREEQARRLQELARSQGGGRRARHGAGLVDVLGDVDILDETGRAAA